MIIKSYHLSYRRHHSQRRRHLANSSQSLEHKIIAELEELEDESRVIREIATGINEDIRGEYDDNEVNDIRGTLTFSISSWAVLRGGGLIPSIFVWMII